MDIYSCHSNNSSIEGSETWDFLVHLCLNTVEQCGAVWSMCGQILWASVAHVGKYYGQVWARVGKVFHVDEHACMLKHVTCMWVHVKVCVDPHVECGALVWHIYV